MGEAQAIHEKDLEDLEKDLEEAAEEFRVGIIPCVICGGEAGLAGGRAYCRECSITFPQPRARRREILSEFILKYYTSKNSPFYHRAGCKYIQNISPENLTETAKPTGRPCRCAL